jgi:hypothetical protein
MMMTPFAMVPWVTVKIVPPRMATGRASRQAATAGDKQNEITAEIKNIIILLRN